MRALGDVGRSNTEGLRGNQVVFEDAARSHWCAVSAEHQFHASPLKISRDHKIFCGERGGLEHTPGFLHARIDRAFISGDNVLLKTTSALVPGVAHEEKVDLREI
jgi:hypothetical protein